MTLEPEPPSEPESVDEKIARDLAANYDQLITMLREGLNAESNVRFQSNCKKCNCRHILYVDVPDFKMKLQIAEFMTNRGLGRPAQAAPESAGLTLIVERSWPGGGTEDPDELPPAA